MKKLFKKSLPLMMAGLMFASSLAPVAATVNSTQTITENNTAQTEVIYNQASNFGIIIPKLIDLGADKETKYTVTITGDISSDEIIKVVPEDDFLMKDISSTASPKDDVIAVVTQDKTEWKFNEFDTIGNGLVSAPDLTAGNWQGSFWFNVSLEGDVAESENILKLSEDNIALGSGESYQVDAFIQGENVNDLVTWESSNQNITVTEGLIETKAAVKAGDTATITAEIKLPQTYSTGLFRNNVSIVNEPEMIQATLSVTIIDIVFTEEDSSVAITSIKMEPGTSKKINTSIIPDTVVGNISWTTTAQSGVNLISSGNSVTIKVADDMPIGTSYYVVAVNGSYSKLLEIKVVDDVTHTCNYIERVEQALSCTTDKILIFECECGKSYTETTPATGHEYELANTTDSTCIVEGKRHYKCKNCDDSYDEAISAVGHKYDPTKYIVDEKATCTIVGSKSVHCDVCNAIITGTEIQIPALGHIYGNWATVKNATCTELGTSQRVCSVCGNTETKDIAVLGHNYTSVVTAPTCTTQGFTTHTCSNCGDTYKDSYVTAPGHTYGSWTTSLNPTCTVVGSKERTCSICGNVETGNVAVLGHNWNSSYTIDKAATCTENGSKSIHCTRCNVTKDVIILPAIGHSYENEICINCGEEKLYEPGLYDANGTMLCRWEDSGIDVETDYTYSTFKTNTTSPYYVITNTYPTTVKVVLPETITKIGAYTFYKCSNISNINIPEGTTTIGQYAFYWCDNLANVRIPSSVITINYAAFCGCYGFTSIEIPNSVTSIDDYAFSECKNVSTVTITNNIDHIEDYVFYGCFGLTNITIPDSITYIKNGAFGMCSKITTINYTGTEEQWSAIDFYNNDKLTSATVHYNYIVE